MSLMYWEKDGTIARVVLDAGKNLHNPDYVAAKLALFDEIEADEEIRAVVISSSDPKNWSQGIDLGWIMGAFGDESKHDEVRGFMHGLNRMFARALTFPVPVIAAIGGHAFGDGAIFSCACDFRFMRSDRGFFCFPEVDVNIPFMPGMQAVVEKAVPYHKMNELYLTGKRIGGLEAAEHHIVEAAADGAEALDEMVMSFARAQQKNRGVFGAIKVRKHRHILAVIERDDPPVIESLKLFA